MKKLIYLFLVVAFTNTISKAQTTALDFNTADCNGNMHHLFSELDSGNVVIMEFFHTCVACISAANDMKPMIQNLVAQYGNKVRFYVAPEDDSETCTSVQNWVSTNGFSSIAVPFDSGGTQSSYYGQGGMPTIAVAAGNTHQLLYLASSNTSSGFGTSDTAIIGTAIRNFLDTTFAGIQNMSSAFSIAVFPNPITDNFAISIEVKEPGMLKLELTNIAGQKVVELTEEKIQAGVWSRNFPVFIPIGIYLIKGQFNQKMFSETITVQQ